MTGLKAVKTIECGRLEKVSQVLIESRARLICIIDSGGIPIHNTFLILTLENLIVGFLAVSPNRAIYM